MAALAGTPAELRSALSVVTGMETDCEEFSKRADAAKANAVDSLTQSIAAAETREAEAAELTRLRAEAEARRQREHEEAIAAKARSEAEAKAAAELLRQKQEADAREARAKAEQEARDRKAAEVLASADRERRAAIEAAALPPVTSRTFPSLTEDQAMSDTAAPRQRSHIKYFPEMDQGSEEWLAARCGLLTASEMKLIITPTLRVASNDKERAHLYELLAQRITQYVEPHYIGGDMLRGYEDEVLARCLYSEKYAPVKEVGFITNSEFGFTLGYSPDGLVGEDGLIECKSRRQKYQIETIVTGEVPAEYMIQVQTGLLVSRRKWLDFVSYSGGLHMVTIRVFPDHEIRNAIIEAAAAFEDKLAKKLANYHQALKSAPRLIPTERRVEQEMYA